MIKAYIYNSCSQCKDVVKALNAAGAEFQVREFFKDKFSKEELHELLESTGLKPDDILSKRSNPYRELGVADKNLSDPEIIALMVAQPRLIRRPIVIGSYGVLIGSKPDDVNDFIQKEISA